MLPPTMQRRIKLYSFAGFVLLCGAILAAGWLLEYDINIMWVTIPLVIILLILVGPL